MPAMCTSFQRGLFYVRDVWLFLCVRHLGGEKRYPSTTLLSPRIQMEDLPLCTFPEVHTYIDGSIQRWCVCVCVWFRVVYFLQVGRCRGCCSGVFWSVIIFRVCSRRSLLPNWGRYFADKPISVSWQKDFQDSGGHRCGSLGLFLYFFCFFVWNGHTIPSLHRT